MENQLRQIHTQEHERERTIGGRVKRGGRSKTLSKKREGEETEGTNPMKIKTHTKNEDRPRTNKTLGNEIGGDETNK